MSTVTVTASLDGCESTADTSLRPPFSPMVEADSDSDTVGRPSSSGIARVRLRGCATGAPDAVPETITVLSGASVRFPTALTVTVPVLAVSPAAMTSRWPVSRKSPGPAFAPAAAETVTVTAARARLFIVAVTTDAPPDSGIEARERCSATCVATPGRVTVPAPPDTPSPNPVKLPVESDVLSATPGKVGLLRVTVRSRGAGVPNAALVREPAGMAAAPVEPSLAVQVTDTASGAASAMRARTRPRCRSASTSSV